MKFAQKIFAANWKLFKTPNQTRTFFREFGKEEHSANGIFIFPPATSWEAAGEVARETCEVHVILISTSVGPGAENEAQLRPDQSSPSVPRRAIFLQGASGAPWLEGTCARRSSRRAMPPS